MRRVVCVSLLVASFWAAGCASSSKNKTPPPNNVPGGGGSAAPFWADPANAGSRTPPPANIPASNSETATGSPLNDPQISGILAGRLLDNFGKPIVAASIQVADMTQAGGKPPLDVDAVNQGHFYIPGLYPGRTYMLTARARVDGRLLVGTVVARPPETKLLIPMSEDYAAGSTPPIPGPPQVPGRSRSPNPAPSTAPATPTGGWAPVGSPAPAWGSDANAPSTAPAAELGAPRSTAPASAWNAEQIANVPGAAPVRANIPQPFAADVPPGPQAYAPSAAVPSCLVSGGRLQTLVLTDSDGRVWDFAQHTGRLVLIDFWGTWCAPCLHALPEVVRLDRTYRSRGLEVVGIACERGTAVENVRRVQEVRARVPGMSYRVLMNEPTHSGLVPNQFQIDSFPTLVLVDSDGSILWRGGAASVPALEATLRQRLGGR